MEKINQKLYARYYLVAFIDILNQSDKLKLINRIPEGKKEEDEFKEYLKETAGKVISFRKSFNTYFSSTMKERPIPENIPENKKEEYKNLINKRKEFAPIIKSISDSIIIYVQLSDNDNIIYLEGIYSTLLACGGCFPILTHDDIIFRAGIDLGIGIQISDDEIYGPVIAKAYELESKIAKYPRIVIGEELTKLLNLLILKNDSHDLRDKINNELALICKRMLMIDGDGHTALDYLGNEIFSIYGDTIGPNVKSLNNFVINQLVEIQKDKNTELYMRYNCILDYINNRMDIWKDYI